MASTRRHRCSGEKCKDLKGYQRAMTATGFSPDNEGLRKFGPRLYRNVLGAGNNVSVLVGKFDPKTLLSADGYEVPMRYLEQNRFSVSDFREIPRVYDVFFERTQIRRLSGDLVSAFLTALIVAKRDFEAGGSGIKTSDNPFGHFPLRAAPPAG